MVFILISLFAALLLGYLQVESKRVEQGVISLTRWSFGRSRAAEAGFAFTCSAGVLADSMSSASSSAGFQAVDCLPEATNIASMFLLSCWLPLRRPAELAWPLRKRRNCLQDQTSFQLP